jgi:FAS-associated factor 2
MSGIRRISLSVFTIVCTFIFGPGGPRLRGGATSGAAFGRALNAAYGAELRLPVFFSGTFAQALQAARLDVKLLVVYLHSENAQHTQNFCTQVLSNDYICTMLNENFLLWGGDVLRVETHFVAQMMHARQYPCFCVLLPANADEIRVIGALHGEVQVDAAVGLLTTCLEEMDAHRAEIVARREQHAEDRSLREQQDREYQEALEMDRRREEQQQLLAQEQREAQRLVEEQLQQEQEALSRHEAQQQELQERRRRQAAELTPEGPEARARISLRLPAGQRVQRRFLTSATLKDVYAWADCAAYLPENEGRDLVVPDRFLLKTSFPTKDLVEMNNTVEDLQLAGTNIVLAAIEDDD